MKTAKTTAELPAIGRPPDSTIYERDKFIKKAVAAYKGFLKRRKKPKQEHIAAKLGVSRSTFCRYLVKYKSWADIRQAAQSEFNEA